MIVKKIYIWGTGKGVEFLEKGLEWSKVELCGYIDNDLNKQGKIFRTKKIISFNQIISDYDYIVISSMVYYAEIREQLVNEGICNDKILAYFDLYDKNFNGHIDFINESIRLAQIIRREYRLNLLKVENIEYEIADKIRANKYDFPLIKSSEEALRVIIRSNCSMCRFGDGEFDILLGREDAIFQQAKSDLAERLRQVLENSNENIITCIANNYGCLDQYTDSAADAIRQYLTKAVREEHMKVIDASKEYYDAYVSRPYILYRDKKYAARLFQLWKQIWAKRDVVIIEGNLTRSGYKNDLFQKANSVERILCPAENAWNKYSEIVRFVLENVEKSKLILIALGPTATVMAYDLAREGYQALDVGHIDNEYEWFIRNVNDRVDIPYKYVAERGTIGRKAIKLNDAVYAKQVIKEIGI